MILILDLKTKDVSIEIVINEDKEICAHYDDNIST